MPVTTETLLPVLTLMLGFGASSINEWLRDRRLREREETAREACRRDQANERRDNFQRKTLLNLQDVLLQLARGAGSIHHHDVVALHSTGKWQRERVPDDVDESCRLAQAQSAVLAERVRDESVRQLVLAIKLQTTAVVHAGSIEEGTLALAGVSDLFEKLNHRIGEVLRGLDDELDAM